MKYENSLTIFAFLLVVSLYLYFVSTIPTFSILQVYGGVIAIIFFAISLLGLFFTSLKIKASSSRFYYFALLVILLFILIFYLFSFNIYNIVRYYLVLAVFIALLLSLLDFRYLISIRWKASKGYHIRISEMQKKIDKVEADMEKQKDETEKQKDETKKKADEAKKTKEEFKKLQLKANSAARDSSNRQKHISELNKRTEELRKRNKSLIEYKKKTAPLAKKLKQNENQISELKKSIDALKERNKKLSESKTKAVQLEKSAQMLQRKLSRSQKEADKQAELKKQYSKTLRHVRKRKKEEQELLVVSPDGKSVHRPKCISVRHITKEHRKLIKNWQTAQKQGYKGCKLCKPHVKPKFIVKGDVKYKFVASKSSDKAHKASCTLVRNMEVKDRDYFRTYKAALKKGYTACRVCIPEQ